MKKNLLLLMCLGLISYFPVAAQVTIKNLNFDVQHADVSFVDIDNDGDLDILVSGETGGTRKLQLFKNDGAGNYTASTSPFTPVTRATFDWDDINNDGKLDLIMSGFPASGIFDSVYTSDGAGNFTRATTIALPQLAPSTGFADLNNDGYTDIYVFGNKFDGKSKIFFNNKTGGFTESAQFDAYNFVDPDVTEVDFDKDGDIDLFVNAGFEDGVNGRFSKMFVNNNGIFTVQNLGIIPKGNGSAVWGDYDNDGDLDLLLNGDGYLGSGEDNDGVYRLYRNTAGVFAEATTFQSYRQNSTGDGGRFADWDNDGDLDIIVTGWNGVINRQATDIYINTGGVFTPYALNANIPGVSESSIEVGDIDNDTDLDLVITGYSNHDYAGAGTAFNSNVTLIVVNPSTVPNLAPTPPTNLNVSGGAAGITFTWNAGTDATTPAAALTYNLFIVNNAGKTFYYPVADTTTGRLLVPRMGNVQLNRSWKITGLPAGTYRWGVQSIDNSFRGSTFAKSNFVVNADGSLPVNLTSFTVVADRNKAKITWSTASELNNDRFEIERSSNGINFNKIATIKANGTTSTVSQYAAYDNSPLKGINYYRLVQYNTDGRSTVYGIRTANFSNGGKLYVSVYPNPVIKDFGIKLMNYDGNAVTVTLTDMMGKQIHKETLQISIGQVDYKINLTTKPVKGNYVLQLFGEGINEQVKVIIN
jgi:hypothetical protein